MNSLKRRKSVNPQSLSYSHPHVYPQDTTLANIDSPFFRLPPEIRNRIYTLVLGVGHIHIRFRPWSSRAAGRTKPFASTATATATTAKETGFYALALPADADPWGRASKKMTRKLQTEKTLKATASATGKTPPASACCSTGYSTALLQVCRQIHAEAALLPFCLNAWSFESTRVMERYLVRDRRLALAQRRAIRVLVVADDLPSRSMERYLGGLRVVVWRDASTKTFERWELPLPKAKGPSRHELLLYD